MAKTIEELVSESLSRSATGADVGGRSLDALAEQWGNYTGPNDMYAPKGKTRSLKRALYDLRSLSDLPTGGGRTISMGAGEAGARLGYSRGARAAIAAGEATPLSKGAASILKLTPKAALGRVAGMAGRAVPLVGAALTAAWLADEAWDATVGKDREGKLKDAEFGLALGTDNNWMQGAEQDSLSNLMKVGADVGESSQRFGIRDQIQRESEVRQSMAPWRAEMASQAYITQPSLPEMLAKMGIDPYMEGTR